MAERTPDGEWTVDDGPGGMGPKPRGLTLCRIYYFKAGVPVSVHTGDNRVHMLGGNCSWTEIGSPEYNVKLRNLCAARNKDGELAYCVFTSECFGDDGRTIDDVIRGLLGARYPAGLYEF